MAITANEKTTLEDLFERCHDKWDELNSWEQNFITDNEARFEKYGDGYSLSPRQWGILNKIDDILVNGRPPR